MNGNKLKGLIVSQGYTIKKFSELVGIKRTALYRKLNGISEFDRLEMSRIINVLNLSATQLSEIFF